MKKIFLFIALITASLALVLAGQPKSQLALTKYLYFSPCDRPITYRIDTVDERFDVARDEFIENVAKASEIWERASGGQDLFIYDPAGKLSINLVYDQRQSLNTQIQNLQDKLKGREGSLKPNISEYERLSKEFKERLDKLNAQIEHWNSQGGAPKEQYDSLIKEQEGLKALAEKLNDIAKSLNQSAGAYNENVKDLNRAIGQFNAELEVRPEEGIYDPIENKIEIYFNIDKNELTHTIAHEFGHALGMGHVQNKKAIMALSTNRQTVPAADDLGELGRACAPKSYIDIYKTKLEFILTQLRQNLPTTSDVK